jgi:TRAP-type C4-dicarboxylate transport system permease large subunit
VWVGMLLKRTELASMCFDVVRPWKLPAELLAFVAVVGAALPTAYSGASGIFVIAVGAIIYQELRKAGARNQLALAATAMSGSMGVVLRPCLLVVVVAAVNKEVTTGPLYSWGFKVFMLTAVLFLIASLINREGPMTCARPADAIPGMFGALRKLSGYVIVFFALLLGYRFVLNKSLDETSAPMILPILMMGLLLFDQLRKRVIETKSGNVRFKFVKAVSAATAETTSHIGALLMLMALSLCVGAVIERAELMAHVPQTFGSIWSTMGVLVFVLVIIGMTMDPYGAVILVSVTLANIANNAGIHPVHFWMVVLVAFELGYLTPPVALNHLLTRQVVGSAAFDEPVPLGANFWARNERILLPVSVMATALLIVAFIPLTGFGKTLWAWFN